ncbi:MAG: anti-sigma factor family protein [Planctomycetota bacterium]|jgi:anti-sigma factor RsiW
MECRDTERLIDAYLDGKLPADRAQGVEEHLTSCRACREKFAPMMQLLGSPEPVSVPHGLHNRVMSAVDEWYSGAASDIENHDHQNKPVINQIWKWSGAIAASIALLFAGWIASLMMNTTEPQQTTPSPIAEAADSQIAVMNPWIPIGWAQAAALKVPANPLPFLVQATVKDLVNQPSEEIVPEISVRSKLAYLPGITPEIDLCNPADVLAIARHLLN